jgi:hypothetical protein
MTDLLNRGIYYYQKFLTEEKEDEEDEVEVEEKDFNEEDIKDKHKEWFFKYFNNFNDTEDEEFNKELNNIKEITFIKDEFDIHFDDESIGFKKNTYSQKLIKLINYVKKKKKNEKINLNEEEVQIIKLKRE